METDQLKKTAYQITDERISQRDKEINEIVWIKPFLSVPDLNSFIGWGIAFKSTKIHIEVYRSLRDSCLEYYPAKNTLEFFGDQGCYKRLQNNYCNLFFDCDGNLLNRSKPQSELSLNEIVIEIATAYLLSSQPKTLASFINSYINKQFESIRENLWKWSN